MSTLITRAPVGLLDLVGTKAQGKNPDQFSAIASLVIDGIGTFAAARYEIEIGGGAIGPGFSFFINVPEGQTWVLFNACALFTTGVGESITNGKVVVFEPAGQPVWASPAIGLAAAQNSAVSFTEPMPACWLPSGWSIGVGTATVLGAPIASLRAWILRLAS